MNRFKTRRALPSSREAAVEPRAGAHRVSSRALHGVVLLLSLVLGILVAEPVAAQSISIPSTAPLRRFPERRSGLPPEVITINDCDQDGTLEVSLNLSQANGLDVQIWSGTSSGCANDDQRVTLGYKCKRIDTFNPNQQNIQVTLKVRDVLPIDALTDGASSSGGSTSTGGSTSSPEGEGGSGGDSGAGGAGAETPEPTEPPEPTVTGSDICNTGAKGGFTLFFLLVDGTKTVSSATVELRADLEGPEPPSELEVGIGEERLFIGWNVGSEADDLVAYRVFCEPATDSASCTAASLSPGVRPPGELEAGRTAQTSSEAPASGLVNGTTYACGVSGVDTFDNVGPLSELVCGMPEPVLGYFEAYRRAGGKAGGGICSFDGPGQGFGGFAAAALVAALAVLRRARGGNRR